MATPLPKPIKGQADWREYEAVQLENGVTVLAVHDKESKTTAMSCCVNVGASADPRSLSGLAHFVEHMCFLGSSKYPGENEYKRYLASHGGRSNASTSMHLTNYKFEVLAEHAEKAVDIFSNFFIDPLFTSSGTVREVQAVDSENSKNLVADGRRRLQILKDLVDPQHYYSKFSTGNSKTLDTSDEAKSEYMRSALLAFHAKHYRPENFTVVIAGPQPLETLQDWIASRFSRIEGKSFPTAENAMSEVETLVVEGAKDSPPYSFKEPTPEHNSPFEATIKDSMPLLLTTKPLRSMRKLVLMFPMKSDRKIPDKSPSNFLSHLLGHEGKGSIFAALQTQGMISSLSSGSRTSGPDFKLFSIDLELTESGEEHWEQVAETVFAYCRMLNKELDQESKNQSKEMRRIWEEHCKLDKIFFDQTSPGSTYSYAPNFSERVNAYGTEECLSAGSMLNEDAGTFPRDSVVETAKFLTPDNCLVERCSQKAWEEAEKNADSSSFGFEKKTEQWYDVDYIVAPIEAKTTTSWSADVPNAESAIDSTELRLPSENRYIPRTLDLCEDLPEEARVPRIEKPIDPPNLLINNKAGRLYHRLDDRYALPKSSAVVLIRNASTLHKKTNDGKWDYDAKTGLKSTMLSVMFSQAMAQETYDASLAGLDWNLSLGPSGIKLHCYGFSDRVPDLMTTVLERFLAGDFLKDAYFVSTKDRLVRGLDTFFSSRRADSLGLYYRDALLTSKDGSINESLLQAEDIDMKALREHHRSIVENKEVLLDCLFTGNVSAMTAKNLFSDVDGAICNVTQSSPETRSSLSYVPATDLERRVMPQEDIELHFQSENPQEENGAVVFTYQSPFPSFRGKELSHDSSLKCTSAVRLLCHMIREPLFDELRTKQQLGYIVSSYYERGFSARQLDDAILDPSMVPVDFITISVLSRKLPPTEIATRIDEVLEQFRSSLREMPESEIRDHADALSKQLLKPIQKLLTESNSHFGKIHRFAPECISTTDDDGKSEPLPWKTEKDLAECIQSLSRAELMETWDRIIGPANRARIVSCVYGNTFPLANKSIGGGLMSSFGLGSRSGKITNDFGKLVDYRQRMGVFNNQATTVSKRSYSFIASPRHFIGSSYSKLSSNIPMVGIGVFGVASVVGWTLTRNQKAVSSK